MSPIFFQSNEAETNTENCTRSGDAAVINLTMWFLGFFNWFVERTWESLYLWATEAWTAASILVAAYKAKVLTETQTSGEEKDSIRNWAEGNLCGIVVKNLCAICSCPENFHEAKFEDGLICLADKISRQASVLATVRSLLATLIQVFSERKQK